MSTIRLNKLCEVEDFKNPTLAAEMRRLAPESVAAIPGYPAGNEHRKMWEFAQLMEGTRQLGALRPDSFVLAVAAGHERPIYALTNEARFVFATDIYGEGDFSGYEAAKSMLVDPSQYAPPFPYQRNRLVVQYMNALDIRHEAETFDVVFSLSSIEHFGDFQDIIRSLTEMGRVCRRGGIVMITTECIVNGAPRPDVHNLYLISQREISALGEQIPNLELVEPPSFDISPSTMASVQNLEKVVADVHLRGVYQYPHVVLEIGGAWFTSISLFFRRI